MIARYSRPEMAALFTDEAKLDRWLQVEIAALSVLADQGIAPQSAAEALRQIDTIDIDACRKRESEIHHDVAAFVDTAAAQAPDAAGWIHYGLTSSDVVDTAAALQLTAACRVVLSQIARLRSVLERQAREYRDTVMLGRTHGMPAEVITFGAKIAGWWHQLARDEQRIYAAANDAGRGKLSGAVGAYSGVDPHTEQTVLHMLGLQRDDSATQIVQRDIHAALLSAMAICASTLDRIAVEIRHLQRSDVGEAAEPFAQSQKGSSAMPHKRNPIVAERISGLARVVRSTVEVGLQNIALWHERDISHSSAERVVIPDAFLALDYILEKTIWLMEGVVVNADRMAANIDREQGLVASQRVLSALVAAGASRDEAYRWVQHAATEVYEGTFSSFHAALISNEAITDRIPADELVRLCDCHAVPEGAQLLVDRLSSRPEPAVLQ